MPKPCPLTASQLEELVGKHGTPLQIYDEVGIRDQVKRLIGGFSEHFPGFQQFFAVKALPNPAILRVVMDEGCGLDCSSASELYIARQLGVPGEKVMYTSNYTSRHDLGVAARQGVIINLDDASLVDELAEACKEAGVPFPERISFRFNPGLGRTDSETKSNVLGGPTAKFGVPREAIAGAYARAKELGSRRFGMHMMTGSCVLSDEYWTETVTLLLQTLQEVGASAGIEESAWDFINIGGGLGIPYREGEPEADPARLAARLRGVVDAAAARVGIRAVPRLMMENGRFVTGPFGWLVARCRVQKRAFGQRYCGLDACMSNLMRPGMYGAYHFISVAGKPTPASGAEEVNVVGTLCENNDWFAKARPLSPSAGVGDLFVIHDTGAHSHSMGFQYNGKLRAPEVLLRPPAVEGGPQVAELIRHRERIADLYSNTRMPAALGPQPRFPADNDATAASSEMGILGDSVMWTAFAAAGAVAIAGAAFAAGRAMRSA